MQIETMDTLDNSQVEELVEWFMIHIGADYELNPSGSGDPNEFYIVFMDMEPWEMEALQDYLENEEIESYLI